MKVRCPTTEQWVKYQIDCYNNLPKDSRLRINAQPIISARYLKTDGTIDWPKFMGMKPETIKGISPDNNLPTNLSRKGMTDFGNTYGDNPNLTNATIAVPYLDNPQAVHFANLSEKGKKRYFKIIDALNDKDEELFISYLTKEGIDRRIAKINYVEAQKELMNFYSSVRQNMNNVDKTLNIKGIVNDNNFILIFESLTNDEKSNIINYKYGLSGVIAPWKLGEPILIGGGNQFSLPFTMDMLKKLRILDIQY